MSWLRLAVSYLLACLAAGAWVDLCSQYQEIDIEVMVFSGMPNPHLLLTAQNQSAFCNVLNKVDSTTLRIPSCTVLGFTGWYACVNNPKGTQQKSSNCMHLRGSPAIDDFLFDVLKAQLWLHHTVVDVIANETARLHLTGGLGDPQCAENDVEWNVSVDASCQGPIRGPNSAKSIHYSPSTDDHGCFVTMQTKNNCYNYGTDIVTNTFAQPGGGVGQITCDRVKAKAQSDGLVFRKQGTYPTSLPTKGHYVAFMAYGSDFHWLREDANKLWSHKPGKTAVRNTDNKGSKIKHPAKHDWSPYHLCGYMRAVPSTLKGPFGIHAEEQLDVDAAGVDAEEEFESAPGLEGETDIIV
jgi:hypothetical protein